MAILKQGLGSNINEALRGDGLVAAIRTARLGVSSFSTESAEIMTSLSNGSGELSLEAHASSLANVFGVNMADPEKEKAARSGLAQASLVQAVSGAASKFLGMVVTPTVNFEGDAKAAASYGADHKSVYSPESFDNQVLTDYMDVSIGLAYNTGRQSAGMEAIYRTIALTPEQGGVDVTIPVLYNAAQIEHPADGQPADWNFRRIIDASIDPSIVKDVATKLIPTLNPDTAANFVQGLPGFTVTQGNRTVNTGFLKIQKAISLATLGTLDEVSKVGVADYSDALDRNVGMDKLLVSLGADNIAFDILGVPYTRFVKTVEKGGKLLGLDVELTTFQINKSTTNFDATPLTESIFDTIADGDYKVQLKVTLNGKVDTELMVFNVLAGDIEVLNIYNAAGASISLTDPSGVGPSIVAGLANLKVEGYTLDAWLLNSNFRHPGLMIDSRTQKERFLTRTRSPVFIPFPLNEERGQSVLDQLTFTVQQQKEADGIEQLVQYHKRIMAYTGGLRGEIVQGNFERNSLPIEGIARWVLNPYVQTAEVDISNAQSLDTVRAVVNGQEKLLNAIRSTWFDILQKTNYINAARYLDGGEVKHAFKPVLFTTDRLQRFMTLHGDSRTLGAGVPFDLYSTVNEQLLDIKEDTDAMYLVIVRDSEGIDVLSAGMMLSTPSLVSTIQVSDKGATVKRVVYQPRYAHYNLCPIVVLFEVKGARTLMEETLPFQVRQVAGGTAPAPEPTPPVDGEDGGEDSGSGTNP